MEVKKNTVVIAAFTYDGDGKRIKSVIGSVTTLYVGRHYEVSGTNVAKYYFAGSQVVALNQGGTLSYLFTDHLGGTAVTATQAGVYDTELCCKSTPLRG